MAEGYGKILDADLTSGKLTFWESDERLRGEYIGGVGFAAKILWEDDTLPARILTHKRGSGGAADHLPQLGKMLNEYYDLRGWSAEGIPSKAKLAELGLQ